MIKAHCNAGTRGKASRKGGLVFQDTWRLSATECSFKLQHLRKLQTSDVLWGLMGQAQEQDDESEGRKNVND